MTINKVYFFLPLLFLLGCSNKKNTWLSRNHQNLTSHYNVFFNGNESFKVGLKAVQEANVDDYTQILPLFPDSKESSKEVSSSQMDRAIEKGVKLIKKHSIRKKPKKRNGDQSVKYQKFISQNEFNKWVDNAYLLIGKSHFYKHDYYLAQQSFAYMFREFQPGAEWSEAEIWNARAAMEMGDFANAKILLDNYDLHGKAPDKLYGFFAATYADYYLRQQMFKEAVPFLQDAIAGVWSKYYKLRFNFVLAQVYHTLGRYDEASATYKKVISMSPPYEMAFNAKVNRASVMFGEGGLLAVQKEIAKLLRDKRNIEYKDQIYYALAMAYKAEKQENEAIDNLLLSVQKSTSNDYQKGLSYYELADIYYVRPEYEPAYIYLDSALVNLDDKFAKLEDITELHKDLEALVVHIRTVEREDSLQRIAAMSEEDRLAFIDDLIIKENERQMALKKMQEDKAAEDFFLENNLQSDATSSKTNWYFYNTNSVALGKSEFENRWGDRKLEDNWRRTNKEVVLEDIELEEESDPDNPDDIFGMPEAPFAADADGDAEPDKNKEGKPQSVSNEEILDRDSFLKDLPLTDEKIQLSDKQNEVALISMGVIYKDEIENIPYAINAFNELLSRFPKSNYIEDALMNLYLCYEIQQDAINMASVRKQIVSQYPDGEFTAFLNDPDYFKKREAKRLEIEQLYEEAYANYLFNDFATPIQNLSSAKQIDEETELLPKFKLLAGLSYAKSGNLTGFEKELTEITKNYSKSDVNPMATKLLAMYSKGRVPVKGSVNSNLMSLRNQELQEEQRKANANGKKGAATSYVVNNKIMHSLIILVNPEADLNRLKFNVADYNFSKFLLSDYEMSNSVLPDRNPVFAISGFKNRLEGMDYFYSLRERTDIFEVDNIEYYKLYVINGPNYEFLMSSGDKVGYEAFFNENYLSAEAFKYMKEEKELENNEDEKKLTTAKDNKIEEEELVIDDSGKDTDQKEISEPLLKNEETNAVKEEVAEILSETEEVADVFVKEEGAHSALVLFKKGRINIQRTGTVFKNYTKNGFGADLNVSYGAKGSAFLYVKVDGFATAEAAKVYLLKVKSDDYLMREISRMEYYLWAISDNNYNRLKNEDMYKQYQDFYKSNY